MLVAVSAVVIGVCALAVSLYETSLMRSEQRASVLPVLELGRSLYINRDSETRDDWRLRLFAENVGIGPARVKHFEVTVDGQVQPTWGAAMNSLLGDTTSVNYVQSTIGNRTIPAGGEVLMFELHDKQLMPRLSEQFDRLNFEACYCSIFDECWITGYMAFGSNTPADGCPESGMIFEE